MYTDLRRLLASLDFRFVHVTTMAPDDFADFEPGANARTPLEIVRHLCDLVEFVRRQFDAGDPVVGQEGSFEEECARFRSSLARLDRRLADSPDFTPTHHDLDYAGILQGPVSDAFTHIGQLAMMRRLSGSPVDRVRYWQVEMPSPGSRGVAS
jgi:hypothetical protein